MMKKMMKGIAILGCLTFAITPVSYLAAETESTVSENTFEEVYSEYKDDLEFQKMLEDYGYEYAEEYIYKLIDREKQEKAIRGGSGNLCYQHVTNVKQSKSNNCGSATILQSLYGMGGASKVAGSTNNAKMNTLDGEYNLASQGSIYVYQVTDALNKYNLLGTTYKYQLGSQMAQSVFENNIANSLTACRPVVLHARTEYFSYYAGKSLGHYLSLDSFDRTARVVRIVDCNYDSAYYGIHSNVPVEQAYNSVHASGRYLIY